MVRYLGKKLIIYAITFFIAVTINWILPRFVPGDPISMLLSEFNLYEGGREILQSQFVKSFGLGESLLTQYFNFWKSILSMDLGVSIRHYPKPVIDIVRESIVFDAFVLLPAICLSWIVGNKLGALSGVNKKVDNFLMPVFYFLTSSPYFWFAMVVMFFSAIQLGWFPSSGLYAVDIRPGLTWTYISSLLHHWFLPFLTMFLVGLGGWGIGMRNMIIYETHTNYAKFMESLGAKDKLIRRYGFRNAVLPQVTGLALQLGTIVTGAVLVQSVFNYPGIGFQFVQAIQRNDYFLMQGCFLALITMVLLANFLVDIVYMLIDPRVRTSFSGDV